MEKLFFENSKFVCVFKFVCLNPALFLLEKNIFLRVQACLLLLETKFLKSHFFEANEKICF